MKVKMRFFGSLFMLLGVLLGAMGSHYVKRILSPESLNSFEVGVRYLIYQGLGMLFPLWDRFSISKNKKIHLLSNAVWNHRFFVKYCYFKL
jgi:uncharacterized membrane protein YgdD (TMEM256/DUF423 family)